VDANQIMKKTKATGCKLNASRGPYASIFRCQIVYLKAGP
jgi:hypothetical protein